MNANKEWDALSATWQQQEAPVIDVQALRREARRRGRVLRWTVVSEIVMSVLFTAFCVAIIVTGPHDPIGHTMLGVLAAVMLVYQVYMVWLRRREWSESGLDADALLDLELRRCATTLHYWRFGMWTVLVLLAAMFAVWAWGSEHVGMDSLVAGLPGALLINVVLTPAIGLYGIWRCRLARRRRERLLALREQLARA